MNIEDAQKIDSLFSGTTIAAEIKIYLSEEELLAAEEVMSSPQQWASNALHQRLIVAMNDIISNYVKDAYTNGWEIPQTKLELLKKAKEHKATKKV
jgi:hypothetical protein